ncbi:MAG: amino acid permease [Alicycliphilus sp.]|uniref:Amino acid permease n=1 Tax=Diaphorobacter limosus TaxID=3036128 RepID=A0ABZ0J5W1_9BURK|nr:amino acid permease [Diaphorobacter sp. Y-1]MBP8779410.1 amino acid permease [Alicycliphilus sp.]WOO33571.1 amino acid permease [Diaphorobacter sp. Y-1]HRN63371.1 amino acid permease [Alicycliphilus sp.]
MSASDSTSGNHLHRALKARHLSMIAIGGSIGTGLFVASGATISQAGPGGAVLAYMVVGLMVYFLMTSLGEMAAYLPTSGSFATYGARYVDEGFGFALGWNYWYNWAVTIAVDLVAAQLVMAYWFPGVDGVLWSAVFLAIMFGLNAISVRGFGEAEYWFAAIKVATVIVFIGIGVLMILGIMRGGAPEGLWGNLALWTQGDAPFAGGFAALIGVAMIVGFSFQGTELIGIAAGESEDPARNIPRAVRQVFWRILLFYVFAILVISLLIPYTDPQLLKNDVGDIAVSPFTLVFQRAGLLSAAAVMNAVVLTSVLSAGNSGMYASTRMLYTLACQRMAPRIFARVSANGVPVIALIATTVVAALCFLTNIFSPQAVYIWLLNLSGMTGFIAWLGIAISHYRFRKGYVAQGLQLSALPYRTTSFPFGPIFAFVLCMTITLGQNYQAFLQERIDWTGVVATYIGLPLFLVIWFGYRLVKGSRIVPYAKMQVKPEAY